MLIFLILLLYLCLSFKNLLKGFFHIVFSILITVSLFGPTVCTYLSWDNPWEEVAMSDHTDEESKKESEKKDKQEKELFAHDGNEHHTFDQRVAYIPITHSHRYASATQEIILPPPEQTA